jgi:hypothetical protein
MAKILERAQNSLLVLLYRRRIRLSSGGQLSCVMEDENRTADPQEFYNGVVETLGWYSAPSPRPVLEKKNFGEDLRYAESGGRIVCNAVHGGRPGVYENASELMPVLEEVKAWFQANGLGSS